MRHPALPVLAAGCFMITKTYFSRKLFTPWSRKVFVKIKAKSRAEFKGQNLGAYPAACGRPPRAVACWLPLIGPAGHAANTVLSRWLSGTLPFCPCGTPDTSVLALWHSRPNRFGLVAPRVSSSGLVCRRDTSVLALWHPGTDRFWPCGTQGQIVLTLGHTGRVKSLRDHRACSALED